DKAPEC
ncbi:HAMP domain protein, partial [Vibrio cholerae HC-02C1]